MGCVWRSLVSFCASCPHLHTTAGAGGAVWSCFSKHLYFIIFLIISLYFFDFFCWSDALSKFTLSSITDLSSVLLSQCFYLYHSVNTTQQQKMLCILQVAQMWSYWSNIWGTASYRRKSGLLAPLGISVLMCSPFGILLPSHLLRACWQVEKPSICTVLVCVHIKVLQWSEFVSLVQLNLLFCSALSPWGITWPRENRSKI